MLITRHKESFERKSSLFSWLTGFNVDERKMFVNRYFPYKKWINPFSSSRAADIFVRVCPGVCSNLSLFPKLLLKSQLLSHANFNTGHLSVLECRISVYVAVTLHIMWYPLSYSFSENVLGLKLFCGHEAT